MDMSRRFLTTAEVAERFRTSPETLRYWRYVGRGPQSFKLGRRVLYTEEAVEAFETRLLEGAGPVAS
jgi:DNA-binding transcriptional MerR regulator